MYLVVGFYLLKHFYYKDEYKELCKINQLYCSGFFIRSWNGTLFSIFWKKWSSPFEQLSTLGCIRWRINRVWNKTGGFSVSLIYEYADEKSYKDCQIEIGKFVKQNESFYKKLNIKRTASRAINILDYQNWYFSPT